MSCSRKNPYKKTPYEAYVLTALLLMVSLVTVAVANPADQTISTVSQPAFLADFTVSPTNGIAPLAVKCTDKSTGNPAFYNYNFGDGFNGSGSNPVHTYLVPGTYSITLTIMKVNRTTTTLMVNSTTRTDAVRVNKVPVPVLVANFTATPEYGTAPLTVSFTDQSAGNPTFYNYNFGDRFNGTGQNPTHTYRFPGDYTVTQTVIKIENGRLVRNTTTRQDLIRVSTPAVGWAIGEDQAGTPAIVHTTDGGLSWQEQGDFSAWPGLSGNDISAVDSQTAWAALGSGNMSEARGAILHTTDGGTTWVVQPIPDGLPGGIKGVKGLSRSEAWAASVGGTILHTVDGGSSWNMVPHPDVYLSEVNRIDAMSDGNVWIADTTKSGEGRYILHSTDHGETWRQESLPNVSPDGQTFVVSAYSPRVVWSTVRPYTDIYRTVDGGTTWFKVAPMVAGNNDFDDICASSAETIWGVLNEMLTGAIYRVHVTENGSVVNQVFSPADTVYSYEGITCLDDRIIWAVGRQSIERKPELPLGVLVYTVDGGKHWVQGTGPSDIKYWKVSFVGAKR